MSQICKTFKIEDLGKPSSNLRFTMLNEDGSEIASYQGAPATVMRAAINWAEKEKEARAESIQLEAWLNLEIQHSEEGTLHFTVDCCYGIPSAGPGYRFTIGKDFFLTGKEALEYINTLERLGLAIRMQVEVYERVITTLDNHYQSPIN